MIPPALQKLLYAFLGIAALWLGIRYLLPVVLPFLLGALLALAAEPAVRFAGEKLRWGRRTAAAAGTALTLVLLAGLVSLVGALAVKELGTAAELLPDLQQTAQEGIARLQLLADDLARRAPAAVRPLVERSASRLLSEDISLADRALGRLPQMLSRVLEKLPGGALGVGTAILSAFMISARLPGLRSVVRSHVPERWQLAIAGAKASVGGWLKAQACLSAVTWGIVTLGFWLLGIGNAPIWALLIAVVDAVPLLGTGLVLLPWALVSLMRRQAYQAAGLLVIYGCAVLTRTVLEPKLVGRQLGLDPLLTLIFLYAGFRFWGVAGMVLAPMLAAAAKGLFSTHTPPAAA